MSQNSEKDPARPSPVEPLGSLGENVLRSNAWDAAQSIHEIDPLELSPESSASTPPKSPIISGDADEAEIRRLAAMVGHGTYDVESYHRKGRLAFPCPLCHCPLEIASKKAGQELTCTGCGTDIIAPDPQVGLPARPAHEGEATQQNLPKANLPKARQVHDQLLAEGQSKGRTKRGAPLPTVDAHLPTPTAPPGQQPIPARGDAVLSGGHLPTQRRSLALTGGGQARRRDDDAAAETPVHQAHQAPAPQSRPAAAPAPAPSRPAVDADADDDDDDDDRQRGAVRLNQKRKDFLPRQEMEGDLEVSQAWGSTEAKKTASKKLPIVAWSLLILTGLATGVWAMKEVFRAKTAEEKIKPDEGQTENQAVTVHRSIEVLTNFFAAETPEERAKYVRHPETSAPRMAKFYGKQIAPSVVEGFADSKESKLDGVDLVFGFVSLNNDKSRLVYLEIPKDDPENVKIDWESLVAWSEMKWDDFLIQMPTVSQEFRVILQMDDYFNKPFQDKNKWICFKIYQPDGFGKEYGYCFGYMELGTLAIGEMAQLIRQSTEQGNGGAIRGRVQIAFTPLSKEVKDRVPQVRILGFRSDWLEL